MNLCPLKLKPLLPAMLLGALVFSGRAQDAGQPIIFSTPQGGDAQSAAPSMSPDRPPLLALPGTLPAPMQFSDFNPPNDFLPPAPAPAATAQQQRMKKLLEDRKNWILMTPAEILGNRTTEKMLGTPERDALGREKNQTQLERYLERQNNLRNGSATNSQNNGQPVSYWNFLRDQDRANSFDSRRDSTAETARNLGQLLNAQRNGSDAANQKGSLGWDAFSQPLPQTSTKPNPEQVAAMERFRQLLSPTPASAQSSADLKSWSAPKPVVDPLMTQPAFVANPAGASFAPLSSGIARPTGLTPLPGTIADFSQALATPAWKPKRAPWLQQGPQPFVVPQQKGF